ncbi:MAG: IS91 family transposase, partial [Burkholderiales bacterium]
MQAHPHPADAASGKLELAHIVRAHGAALRGAERLSGAQLKALRAIARCRTAALGGQLAQCDHCGQTHYRYHSCRNRHCPKCQTLTKERWLERQRAELLPVAYFHLVFTLPHELNALAQGNPRAIYGLLFAAVSKTLLEFGRNPRWLGGEIAASLLLHTWNQVLLQHIHLHCLVAGGALAQDGQWISSRRGFLFPAHALSAVFRGKFLERLGALLAKGK